MKFSFKDFFRKGNQTQLLKKSIIKNFNFCAVLHIAEAAFTGALQIKRPY